MENNQIVWEIVIKQVSKLVAEIFEFEFECLMTVEIFYLIIHLYFCMVRDRNP